MKSQCVLLFRDPEFYLQNSTPADWTSLVSEARQHALLGSIYFLLQDVNLLELVPTAVLSHLTTGFHYAEKQKITLLKELLELESVFASVEFPCILVKGVGYRLAGLPFSRGRVFSDIDLLIPHDNFPQALSLLTDAGYLESGMSDYDRRYYIEWSHQHPPLTHFLRGANIDLHHHIFPVSSTSGLAIKPMFDNAIRLSGSSFSVPSTPFLFVHAAVHLFYQEETHKLVKDLCDLKQLYEACMQTYNAEQLVSAANDMHAEAAVFYALDTLRWLFKLNIDAEILNNLAKHSSTYRRWQMQFLLKHLLNKTTISFFAHIAWFIRGHLLKMGVGTLIYHSMAKFWEYRKIRKMQSQEQKQIDDAARPPDAK